MDSCDRTPYQPHKPYQSVLAANAKRAGSIVILCGMVATSAAQTSNDATQVGSYDDAIRSGDVYYQNGRVVGALSEWSRAYELAKGYGHKQQSIAALARRAEAYAALGYYKNAEEDLKTAIASLDDVIGDGF